MKYYCYSFLYCFCLKKNLMLDKTGSKYTQMTPGAYAFWEVSTVFWLCLIISNYVLQHKIKYFCLHCVYLFMSWALIVKQCILLFIYTRCEYLCCSVLGSQLGLYLYIELPGFAWKWFLSPTVHLQTTPTTQQLFFFFLKRKNLWITRRFLLWLFWSLTNKPARIHFGGQENSIWDLLHSLRCSLLRNKSCLGHKELCFWNTFAYC